MSPDCKAQSSKNYVELENSLRNDCRRTRRTSTVRKDKFSARHHQDVANAGVAYRRKQRQTPNDHFHLEFEAMYDENVMKGLSIHQITD